MMDKIRSVIFNILFYGVHSPLICILLLPSVFISGKAALKVARFYQWSEYYLEKYILGLDYEIRGKENLPQGTSHYLVGMKHYSAYETLKLYHLFYDPTVILTQELLSLPFFGRFLTALDFIAVDRSNREKSMSSLQSGAEKMREQNRPIVIFPQGTRVAITDTPERKPYKGGIGKLYAANNLAVVPIAHNSGLFWPRNSFWKKSGTVIFEIMPPIPPGMPEKEMMQLLEEKIETESNRLVEEGQAALAARK